MSNILKALGLTMGLGLLLASSTQAASRSTERIQIPFDFKIGNTQLRAGSYRIVQRTNEPVALLVNTESGKQIQILRPNDAKEGKARLVFELQDGGYVLKKIS
jgi:hypothetical protein